MSEIRVHTFHGRFNLLHSTEDLTEAVVDVGTGTVLLEGVDDFEGTGDECASLLDHVDVGQDEAGLGALGVQATLECADQAEVGVLLQTLGGIGNCVVEESIGGSIGHEGRKVQTISVLEHVQEISCLVMSSDG